MGDRRRSFVPGLRSLIAGGKMETLTYKTPADYVTGSLQTWLSVMLESMSPEVRARVFEQVKQREADKMLIINPDGTTTTVLRAQKGILKANGNLAGG